MGDVFLIIFIIGIPAGFALYSKGKTRVLWLISLAGMGAVLGLAEYFCRYIDADHLTLSQRFYALPPASAWAIGICMLVGWLGLLAHLLYGNWKKHQGQQ